MGVVNAAQITAAPDSNLVKRQLASSQNLTPTCGWMSADPASPNICYPGETCAVNTFYSVHECCSGAQCTDIAFPTACVGAATSCDSDCQNNALILKCPIAGLPGFNACATRMWEGSFQFSGFGCTLDETTQTVYTTNTAGSGGTPSWYSFGERAAVGPTSSASRPTQPTSAPLTGPTSHSSRPTSASPTTSSSPTNTGNHSSSNSSFDVVALAAALGAIVGLGLLLVLGFFVYRWRKRLPQRKSNNDTALHAFGRRSDSDMSPYPGPGSSAGKSYAVSSTTAASSAASFYRGSEAPSEFGHYHQKPFEMDGSARTAELYGMRSPVEAASQSRYEVPAGHEPIEAGSTHLYEAPAGTYQPMQHSYQR